jgi:beta-mannanase
VFDPYIDSWAQGLAAWEKPVLLRFGHEMNGDWYPWAAGANGNSAQQFIDAWIYLHERFTAAGATNVYWVWSPIASAEAAVRSVPIALEDVFPGDAYVDFVGASGFNWGDTPQPWGVEGWETFSDIFQETYAELQALSTKPVLITETASAELGGDKGAWITSAFLTEIPERFPAIEAVVWFNVLKETDWRIDSSVESLRAFVTAANSPEMQGSLVFG